ncbi:MAG: NADH-quinone oxidoreductase subunit NuoF [Phycisphaerae bacterium]|nr:NADH-quinone oxidoreductase subunit NuoF [Phycisphaerae bacterium]
MAKFQPILTRNYGVPNSRSLEVYRERGGYQALAKALEMGAEAVGAEVKKAELRGRGGAGFPAGVKWSFLPPNREITYLCVNSDEAEPPTFKDRTLIENDPHQLIEGILIAGFTTRTKIAYVYMRAEFHRPFHILQKALDEAYKANLIGRKIMGSDFSMDIYIHRGAGAYVCGEETGLIESIEGKRGWPRIKPPFPAVAGLFGKPTVINNVETMCCVPHIIREGADWFLSIGPDGSKGPKVFAVSGPVKRPGVYEAAMDITCRDLIFGDDFAQGMVDGQELQGVLPGGISMGILRADELDCKLDFDDVRKHGLLGLGTGAAVVVPKSVDIRMVLLNLARFYAHESCGQCTHCREGTSWMAKIAKRIADGAGRVEDLDLLIDVSKNMGMMPGLNICGLSDGAGWPIRSVVEKFRGELEAKIKAQPAGAAERAIEGINPAYYDGAGKVGAV